MQSLKVKIINQKLEIFKPVNYIRLCQENLHHKGKGNIKGKPY
ncbi:MAG: hypothetical protein UU23_C0004G0022 [Candidatus Curtissbacteria bacterium GW2011_GWA1_40_9]|uniref:Uncharacterized protein n=1 Tax=Candidatus Curtissbacteria bacterium GW2011_GWA1_40_9 TaxID=1618408 RepID=A0A0G0W122_9BACT|nr:MAG: hypothetical protein UU23_C0004G0022 [Candidatus Curtissbacteria bacterium GW2011_GWA1_40_9]